MVGAGTGDPGKVPVQVVPEVVGVKRTPLNPRSPRRVAEDREREKAKVVVRERAKGRCEASALLRSVNPDHQCGGQFDFHEVLTRARGGSITDPANILYCCRRCHSVITEEPRLSESLGLVRNSWTDATTKANAYLGTEPPRFRRTPSTALRATNTLTRPGGVVGGYESSGRAVTDLEPPASNVGPPSDPTGEPGLVTLRFIHFARPFTVNGERKLTPYQRAEVVKEWREAFCALAIGSPKLAWANVEVYVYLRDGRTQDTCGAVVSYKAAQDGIVDAGVLVDDGPEQVRQVTFYPPKLRTYDALELVLRGEPV